MLSQRLGFIISLSLCADEVTMKEMAKKNQQLRAGEILIIVVVLFMWAGQFHLSVGAHRTPRARRPARCALPLHTRS